MILSKLNLQNFRNYKKKSLDFSKGTTVIIGPNASGKTNILEAIYILSTGKSFRARREEEMVSYNSDIGRIAGKVNSEQFSVNRESEENNKTRNTDHGTPITNLEVVLTRGTIDIGADRPERVPRKKLMVNGIARHLYTFVGNLKVVLFGPWDMDLVTESPSVRRRFLDSVLSQADKEYRRSILSYEKGLRQRNRILLKIREEGFSRNALMFWDQLLIKAGNYITDKREEFIEFANSHNSQLITNNFSLEYDSSVISEGRLEQYKDEEVAAATTLVGPHRDDFSIVTNFQFPISNFQWKKNTKEQQRDLAKYGSRGEQRMGILWLKLAELSFIEEQTKEKPTLLLDDIFSELDHRHRDVVMEIVKSASQVIITSADEHFIIGLEKNSNKVISLQI